MHWPSSSLDPLWIEAQVFQESRDDPKATSAAGALGLMQLMPGTARELGVEDPFDPEENLDGGIRHLVEQHRRFAEIPTEPYRFFWSLAAYNGGRGYCNKALELARAAGLATWARWDVGSIYLASSNCVVRGRRPDHHQIWDYVAAIRRGYYARRAQVPTAA